MFGKLYRERTVSTALPSLARSPFAVEKKNFIPTTGRAEIPLRSRHHWNIPPSKLSCERIFSTGVQYNEHRPGRLITEVRKKR